MTYQTSEKEQKRIEKIRHLSYILSVYIQYFVALTIVIAILISFWSLPHQLSALTDIGSESLISFLKYVINIIIAVELIRVLCHQTLDTIVEILLMAVTRELIIERMSVLEMLFGVVAVAVLFAVRKYLYVSRLDKNSRPEPLKKEPQPEPASAALPPVQKIPETKEQDQG